MSTPPASAGFRGRHLCHINDFNRDEFTFLLDRAESYQAASRGLEAKPGASGKVLATLFFEPSTRTRLSFESAMARLGGSTLTVAQPGETSVMKGETLSDTIRMVAAYSDAIVLRHPHEGAARLAASVSSVPVVNAGDGAGQHPTQTLLDLYTIRKEKSGIEGNKVAVVGDLRYGRTAHSLVSALARFDADMTLVAPPELQMPEDAFRRLKAGGARAETTTDLEDVIETADVLYVTRIQKERFPDLEEYKRVQGVYRVTPDLLSRAKKGLIVMHPLPRLGEIDPAVDRTPHAKYFEQAANGVAVRMALLSLLLGVEPE